MLRLFAYFAALLWDSCEATVDIYGYSWECTPVSFDNSYMGGPPEKGNQLTMEINDEPMEEFQGFTASTEGYSLKMKSVHDWNQYVIFVDHGLLTLCSSMIILCAPRMCPIATIVSLLTE